MAFLEVDHIAIKGIACAVPKDIKKSEEYEYFSEHDKKMFIQGTGIKERRMATEGVCASDLCFSAAQRLIEEMNINKEEIKCLIFVSQSPDYFLPSSATILQNRLGLSKSCLAFDVGLGCSGYVYGLSIVSSLLQNMEDGYGLLLAGDISTNSSNPRDKSTRPLFGDAGTATIVNKNNQVNSSFFNLQSDGAGHESIIIRGGGTRYPYNANSFEEKEYEEGIWRNELNLEMDGLAVFNFALKEVKPNVLDLLQFANHNLENIDFWVMHQANLFMNETVRKKLKIDKEKVPYSLEKFGNTSSASIPLTMVTEMRQVLEEKQLNLLLSGFGVGLSWGSVLLQTSNLHICDLIEIL